MTIPSIAEADFWANFERRTLEVFTLALEMLSADPQLPEIEDDENKDSLNRRLYQYVRQAMKKWEAQNRKEQSFTHRPLYNCRQPPNPKDIGIVHSFERKKPDFQWEIRDSRLIGIYDETEEEYISYHIECKRLRSKSSSSYFTSDYVKKGICRFIQQTHCYGQHAESGAMIAYVQDMELQTLLDEVNTQASTFALPQLELAPEGWQMIISKLNHRLDRPEVQPTPFSLHHLWVDLRQKYTVLSDESSQGRVDTQEPSKPAKRSHTSKSSTSSRKTAQPARKPEQKRKRKTQ